MAVYQYKCNKCNKEKEIECSVKDYQSSIPCECGHMMERDYGKIKPISYGRNCDSDFYGVSNSK